MRRYPLVIAGTVAGIAGVLAFPTHHGLTVPSAAGTSTTTPSTSGPSTTAPGATTPSSTTPSSTVASTRSATSADETYRYGDLAVTVTVRGTTITDVAMASLDDSDGRSAAIDSYALPQLERQVIKADSAKVDGVSGATFTSQAFVDAVANALDKLGWQA